MTPDELRAAAYELFPGEADPMRRLAEALGNNPGSFRKMGGGSRPVPEGLAADVRALLEAKRATGGIIGPPPDGLGVHLDALAAKAIATGLWTDEQVTDAVIEWVEEGKEIET